MKNYFDIPNENGEAFRLLKHDHYKNLDVEFWYKKVHDCHANYLRYSSDKYKARALFEAYTNYLQLTEIFHINLAAAHSPPAKFIPFLFMDGDHLRASITATQKQNNPHLNNFFEHVIMRLLKSLHGTDKVALDKDTKYYQQMFKDAAKDYLSDYHLLNSFKHGFRVHYNSGKSSIFITINGKRVPVLNGDASIEYFSKVGTQVFQHHVIFNTDRIFGMSHFMYAMFYNLVEQQKYFADPKRKSKLRFFSPPDKVAWAKSAENFRYRGDFAKIINKPTARGKSPS